MKEKYLLCVSKEKNDSYTSNQEKRFRNWRAGFELRAGLLYWDSLCYIINEK